MHIGQACLQGHPSRGVNEAVVGSTSIVTAGIAAEALKQDLLKILHQLQVTHWQGGLPAQACVFVTIFLHSKSAYKRAATNGCVMKCLKLIYSHGFFSFQTLCLESI